MYVPDYGVLTQTTLRTLTTVSTSNPVPKIIKNWNVDGNGTLGELKYRRAVYFFTKYLISHSFYTNCLHCFMLCLKKKKTKETNHFQYKYTFYIQDHIWRISKFYYNYTTSKLNFWSWNKTAYIWQWKDKEDCNKNQLDALFIHSLFHQSTSTCFRHMCSPSSGAVLYIYNCYVLCFSVDRLLAGQQTVNEKVFIIEMRG